MNAASRLITGFPIYNGEDFVSESLDALLDQTYEGFELIISDTASTGGGATSVGQESRLL